MELKEFVKNTLLSITDGVYEASDLLQTKDYNKKLKRFFTINEHESRGNSFIHFDVAVTVQEELKSKGDAEGKLIVLSVNLQGEASHSEEKLSRVQFKVLFSNFQ